MLPSCPARRSLAWRRAQVALALAAAAWGACGAALAWRWLHHHEALARGAWSPAGVALASLAAGVPRACWLAAGVAAAAGALAAWRAPWRGERAVGWVATAAFAAVAALTAAALGRATTRPPPDAYHRALPVVFQGALPVMAAPGGAGGAPRVVVGRTQIEAATRCSYPLGAAWIVRWTAAHHARGPWAYAGRCDLAWTRREAGGRALGEPRAPVTVRADAARGMLFVEARGRLCAVLREDETPGLARDPRPPAEPPASVTPRELREGTSVPAAWGGAAVVGLVVAGALLARRRALRGRDADAAPGAAPGAPYRTSARGAGARCERCGGDDAGDARRAARAVLAAAALAALAASAAPLVAWSAMLLAP